MISMTKALANEEHKSVRVHLDETEDDELSLEDERDRLRLERQVERAFYTAGCALRQLRDRRLYRSTHKTFREYCQDRFGFTRSHPYRLIDAASVIDNLSKMSPNGRQNNSDSDSVGDSIEKAVYWKNHASFQHNGLASENQNFPILPTSERQCRPLTKLEPEQQQEVWQQAIKIAKGKVPSGKIVSNLVSQIKGTSSQNKQHKLKIGQQVTIKANHPLFAKRLGIIRQIPNRSSAILELDNGKTEMISQEYLNLRCDPSGCEASPKDSVSQHRERAPRQEFETKNQKLPSPGLTYTQGLGIEYNVRLSQETWEKLNKYAKFVGTATLDGAIARLLDAISEK